jgi:hypothetical protein
MAFQGFWLSSFATLRRAETIVGALAIVLLPTLILAAWPAPTSDSAFDSGRLEKLLQRNPATGRPVDSIAELVPLLPRELRSNFTFVYDSRSPFRASISPEFPRAVLFTDDARLVLTFTGDPVKPSFDLLETLAFDDQKAAFTLRSYLLPAAERRAWRPTPEDADCARCHGADARPIFDSYPLWPGFYGSVLDAFPRDRLGVAELAKYRAFLHGAAKSEPYRSLLFPKGSTTSPYLDPRLYAPGTVQLEAVTMPFLPNTRLGMALTELNRARIYRKLAASEEFRKNERRALAALLECRGADVPEDEDLRTIEAELKRENEARLQRLGWRSDEPRPDIDNMEELKLTRELAEIVGVAARAGIDHSDWSMALEPGSMAFFDGILSGMHRGKSFYLKEDLIYEMLSHLSQREPVFRSAFEADWDFAELGYPFGDRVDLAKAVRACSLLSAH